MIGPGLTRASTPLQHRQWKDVDGRDRRGRDDPADSPRMTVRLCALAALAILLAASAADAQKAPAQVACTGPFAKSVTHASLVKAFGQPQVAFLDVGTGEGETAKASVIFPRDAARRIEILWKNERARRDPAEIRTGVEAQWSTARGIRRGMTLAEIEALNGRPFELYGFGFDYGGTTLDWKGGALAQQPGGCTLTLRFAMREGADNAGIYGEERSFSSDDEPMRIAAPVVDAVMLIYGE